MRESVRIVRFCLIGTMNALITALVIGGMMEGAGADYLLANVTAYVVAQTHNFVWSKYWVFSARQGRFMQEIPLFLLAFGCAYATQFLFLLLLVEGIGLNEYLGQFLGLFVYGAVNFLMNKKITFRGGY